MEYNHPDGERHYGYITRNPEYLEGDIQPDEDDNYVVYDLLTKKWIRSSTTSRAFFTVTCPDINGEDGKPLKNPFALADISDKEIIDKQIIDFKKNMKSLSIDDLALSTGVKGISKYTDKSRGKFTTKSALSNIKKSAPAHVKAAIRYNDLLKYWGLNNFEQIKSSEKIKWIYLKPNTMNIKQIGFKGYDDPPKIMEFIKQNIDYDKLFTRALEKKIRMFYEALQWDMPVDKINTLERFF